MKFETAGEHVVLCFAHPEMEAYIVITDSPYAAVSSDEGTFEMQNVPSGAYTARVWNVDEARRGTRSVTIDGALTEIDLTEPRIDSRPKTTCCSGSRERNPEDKPRADEFWRRLRSDEDKPASG